ncbi:uncharacterized protein EI97DRAFT_416719 [Westerdykella ornata]|uniref:Uncharacterized protein n=1 Tax=Westerdykella ornata TaxID=318751 RepID=A0A6A6JM19_WESOR|nr:uncharacterized protein EI97DRAFT_416719 [Westerdykella ornata]KAF2277641.1 hypothetical protein EI97DRAFT_416719 [Westerdykella ornata]
MGPTPVRIRGRKGNRSIVSSWQSQISPPAKAAKASTSQSAKHPRPSKHYVKSTPTLQGLPPEILDIIFLESMNISLPRASPDLGRKLSSKTTCMEFAMRCFFETVDLNKEFEGYVEDWPADPVLQSQLLASRFFTWEFFVEYFQKSHGVVFRLFDHIRHASSHDVLPNFQDLFTVDDPHPRCIKRATSPIGLGSFSYDVLIPEKLLHGPWTPDKTKLLYVLVTLECTIDWNGSTAGETAKEGLLEAIAEGDERAVAALSVLLLVDGPLNTDYLRYAVTECGCNFTILRPLLCSELISRTVAKGAMDLYDPTIWRWADCEGAENGKGTFLKKILSMADDRSGYFSGYVSDLEGWPGRTELPEFEKFIPLPYFY